MNSFHGRESERYPEISLSATKTFIVLIELRAFGRAKIEKYLSEIPVDGCYYLESLEPATASS
jgi:hypothetical protein